MPSAQPTVSPITIETIDDPSALGGLTVEWEPLVAPTHPGSVFRSGAWLLPWWECFSHGARPRILLARRGTRLVAALPCVRNRGPLGIRTLRLLGDNVVCSDALGVIAAPADLPACSRAIAERLLDDEEDISLSGLLAGDALLEALDQVARRRGLAVTRRFVAPSPYLDLVQARGDGGEGAFDRWLATLPRGAGAQLRRRRRWLERQPGFRLDVAEHEAEVLAAVDVLLRLHEARWAEQGGSAGIPDESVRRFHRYAARELARRGWARIYLLRVGGAVRAAFYGFERGGRFAFYQSGSDPAWRQRSVGTVVLGAALEDAFRRGLGEFDFLRGDEPYKETFASGRRELWRIEVAVSRRARTLRLARSFARRTVNSILPRTARDAPRGLAARLRGWRTGASDGDDRSAERRGSQPNDVGDLDMRT